MFPILVPENKVAYSATLYSHYYIIYWIFIVLTVGILFCLPFIYFDISLDSVGILRPADERTDVRSLQTGVIDTIFYRNGDTVTKGDVIFRLKNDKIIPKKIEMMYELEQTCQFLHDLQLLTTNLFSSKEILNKLQSPLYRQQVNRFLYQLAEQELLIKKVRYEIDLNTILIKDKIIAPKEQFDKEIEYQKLIATNNAFRSEQISMWQQQLARYMVEYSQLEMKQIQIMDEEKTYSIRAPVSGVILGTSSRYNGSIIEAGESFCIISPETDLIAECYVTAQDVGVLKVNQPVKLKVDAFDYKFFGTVSGKIISIDNDFTLFEAKPVFKVRCKVDCSKVSLGNGFKGTLKKGLTLQVRFVLARRSAWQLVFDKLDDWLNPETRKPTDL